MSATTQRQPRFAAAAAQMGAGVLAPGVELVRLGQFAQRSGIYLVLIALLLVPALWLPEYRNVLNLGQIVQQSAALAILAIGQTFVIACRMIDLSVGQLMGLIVVASCSLMEGRPEATIPAILLALAIGLAVGAINGFLNNRLRIHSLILTLGMLSILQGAIFVYTDRSVGAASPAVLRIGNGTVMGVPVTVPLVLVVPRSRRCCCTGRASASTSAWSAPTKRARGVPASMSRG
jgi:ribose/xylose/arabinose/galactoside ABC-type transport system permease subunit